MSKINESFVSTVKMDRAKGRITKENRSFLIREGKKGNVPYQESIKHKWDPDFDYHGFLKSKGR